MDEFSLLDEDQMALETMFQMVDTGHIEDNKLRHVLRILRRTETKSMRLLSHDQRLFAHLIHRMHNLHTLIEEVQERIKSACEEKECFTSEELREIRMYLSRKQKKAIHYCSDMQDLIHRIIRSLRETDISYKHSKAHKACMIFFAGKHSRDERSYLDEIKAAETQLKSASTIRPQGQPYSECDAISDDIKTQLRKRAAEMQNYAWALHQVEDIDQQDFRQLMQSFHAYHTALDDTIRNVKNIKRRKTREVKQQILATIHTQHQLIDNINAVRNHIAQSYR